MNSARIIHGDCVDSMLELDANSIDACVTDPPYELGFMGKRWDRAGIAFSTGMWRAVWQLLKPGGHLLAFGGTRTYHRMACAIEDAGFEIRDSLHWFYGNGFPKSRDLAREVELKHCTLPGRHYDATLPKGKKAREGDHLCPTIPDVRAKFDGRGTALKPGHEPIVMARKPLAGTLANTVELFGTSGLNIDACRLAPGEGGTRDGEATADTRYTEEGGTSFAMKPGPRGGDAKGRWPSNVLLDEDAAFELDAQSGVTGARAPVKGTEPSNAVEVDTITNPRARVAGAFHADSGGASRFFYVAKPSRAERDLGCESLPLRSGGEATDREDDTDGLQSPRAGAGRRGGVRNYHPTVKPVLLMRHLVKLVTPPGGLVLDPFAGSGTTGMAARMEGLSFVGMEKEAEYVTIAEKRIAAV